MRYLTTNATGFSSAVQQRSTATTATARGQQRPSAPLSNLYDPQHPILFELRIRMLQARNLVTGVGTTATLPS